MTTTNTVNKIKSMILALLFFGTAHAQSIIAMKPLSRDSSIMFTAFANIYTKEKRIRDGSIVSFDARNIKIGDGKVYAGEITCQARFGERRIFFEAVKIHIYGGEDLTNIHLKIIGNDGFDGLPIYKNVKTALLYGDEKVTFALTKQ